MLKGRRRLNCYPLHILASCLLILKNFGNVVLEALAEGTPVVTSKGTPWQDLENEKAGFWVENTSKISINDDRLYSSHEILKNITVIARTL